MTFLFLCGQKKQRTLTTSIIAQPDIVLFNLLNLSPWDDHQRRQFDNDALRRRILDHPEGVLAKYEFAMAGRGSSIRYPFHRAIALGATLDVIQYMYDLCPIAIEELGIFSSTPLHVACAYRASKDVIQFLLQEYPTATKIRTKHGYFPLHNACEYGVSTPTVIELLVQVYPQALQQRNKLGQTPYMTVQRQGDRADPNVLEILQRYMTRLQLVELSSSTTTTAVLPGGTDESTGDSSSMQFLEPTTATTITQHF